MDGADVAAGPGQGAVHVGAEGRSFNDLLALVEPPSPGDTVVVAGLNSHGQAAGNSDGHAVRWDFVDDGWTVTDLDSISSKAVMTATGTSDSGRIVGTSRIRTGRRSKAGPSWVIEDEVIYELLALVVNAARPTLPSSVRCISMIRI